MRPAPLPRDTAARTLLLASLLLPLAARAEDIPGYVWPGLAILLSHLYPAMDLLRRKAWSFAALYVFSQPVVWGLAGSIAYVVMVFSSPESRQGTFTPAVLAGLAVLAVTPFIYWRMLTGWLAMGADEDED